MSIRRHNWSRVAHGVLVALVWFAGCESSTPKSLQISPSATNTDTKTNVSSPTGSDQNGKPISYTPTADGKSITPVGTGSGSSTSVASNTSVNSSVINTFNPDNGASGQNSQTGTSSVTTNPNPAGNATNGRPYCRNNGGQGYGSDFDCGGGLRCKKDDGSTYADSSICVYAGQTSANSSGGNSGGSGGDTASNGRPYCKNNGGQGYGSEFDCGGGLTCKKDDGSTYAESSICVIKK